ncbi:MAG: hypothetical protein WD077_09965 [Bacteroidia bacterium]
MEKEEGKYPEQQRKEKRNRSILIGLIVLLIAINGVIGFMLYRSSQERQETAEALVESQELRVDLENQLADLEDQLLEYRGQNAELDSMVAVKTAEIERQAEEIRQVLREKQITLSNYQKAQKDIEVLRYYIKKYTGQIDSLSKANTMLTEENTGLKETVKTVKLESDKIKDVNVRLENKLSLGSMLQVEALDIAGIRLKGSGKEKETYRAKHIDQIKTCFSIGENLVAEEGYRDVFMKVIDSEGSTIHAESLGSGTFELDGDQALYSTKKEIYYNNKPQNYCIYFDKGNAFTEGTYTIELYTEGYLLGKQSIEIK